MKCPLERINGVWLFRREPHWRSRCHSLPGHLVHLIVSGGYRLKVSGREYDVEKGDLILYHDTESVEGFGGAEGVAFYSAGFFALGFEPMPVGNRVLKGRIGLEGLFRELYDAWNSNSAARRFLCHSLLLRIIAEIEERRGESALTEEGGPWSQVEAEVRSRRLFRASLDDLASISGRSRSSVVRDCRADTGQSPLERLREIRMNEAHGLLKFASLNVSQVAAHLGYRRVHEFSRDFSGYFGHPPREVLKEAARTRRVAKRARRG